MKGRCWTAVLAASLLSGCGWVNPNWQTIWNPAASTYQIAGALTRGFASRPKVAYVQTEGNNPDVGSFHHDGDPNSGIDSRGIYIPSALISVGADNLLDVYPDKNIASTAASVAAGTNGSDNNGTFPYAYISPFGVNGATLYAKLKVKF